MRINDNKGFTLIELVATIVILSIVMGIGAFSITEIIRKNKENDYKLLITEIKGAVESYYQECRFVDRDCGDSGNITLGSLVNEGFLKGNDKDDNGYFSLVNPNNNKNISGCEISWEYSSGNFTITAVTGGDCPKTTDYN